MTVPTREIRHQIPAWIVNALDGQALGRGIDRGELLTQILAKHVRSSIHEAKMLLKFADGNGPDSDTSRSASE